MYQVQLCCFHEVCPAQQAQSVKREMGSKFDHGAALCLPSLSSLGLTLWAVLLVVGTRQLRTGTHIQQQEKHSQPSTRVHTQAHRGQPVLFMPGWTSAFYQDDGRADGHQNRRLDFCCETSPRNLQASWMGNRKHTGWKTVCESRLDNQTPPLACCPRGTLSHCFFQLIHPCTSKQN